MSAKAIISWLLVVAVVMAVDTQMAAFIGHHVSASIESLANAVNHGAH